MAAETPTSPMPTTADSEPGKIPLCVDLDGSLVKTDTLLESALLLLQKNVFYIFAMLFWLRSGKANLKEQIAARTTLDVTILPYNQPLLDWLLAQRTAGRSLILVTAASGRTAGPIADHLQLFSRVIASSSDHNLSAGNKRDELDKQFGKNGYDYVGNSRDDLKVWAHCRRAGLVNASAAITAKAKLLAEVEIEFAREQHWLRSLIDAMRPHQWSKNLLVFVNILMAHELLNVSLMMSTVLAFVAFCLCSSSVYLVNDLLDLEADRRHSVKHRRPFASGRAPLMLGIVAAPALLLVAIALASLAGSTFLFVLVVYFLATLAYSFYLKRIVILDVLVLASLYTLRIVGGAGVAELMPSFWLLAFSMFIFTSLAMAKRYAELKSMETDPEAWISGRGYHVGDLTIISQLGLASGYIAALVLALYINSSDIVELYRHEELIWLLCPALMYWIGRIWLLASRGVLHQDPIIFATRDRVSYAVGIFGLLTLWAAL